MTRVFGPHRVRPNLKLSDEPELQKLMSRDGWGNRITCLEVAGLSPTVLRDLRDEGAAAAIFDEIAEAWAYSLYSPLYGELVAGFSAFDSLRNPKPLAIAASVEVSDGGDAPRVIDLNDRAQQKYAPSPVQQPSSSSAQPPRRGGLRAGGGDDAGDFFYSFEVTDGGKTASALLRLRYYPIKEGTETRPEGCKAGFDVRWQGRVLKDEPMRLLPFMDPMKLSNAGRGGTQKELRALLQVTADAPRTDALLLTSRHHPRPCFLTRPLPSLPSQKKGHRVSGELLLDHGFAVNKNKSQLLRTGGESSSGSVELVKKLDKPPADWQLPGRTGPAIESFLQWLKKSALQDEEFRFVYQNGDVEMAPQPFYGFVSKVLQVGAKITFKAPMSQHGVAAETQPLRLWLHKELSKVFNKKDNAILAEVHSFHFTELTGLNSAEVEEECNDATEGKVIFRAWTDKQSDLQVNDQPPPPRPSLPGPRVCPSAPTSYPVPPPPTAGAAAEAHQPPGQQPEGDQLQGVRGVREVAQAGPREDQAQGRGLLHWRAHDHREQEHDPQPRGRLQRQGKLAHSPLPRAAGRSHLCPDRSYRPTSTRRSGSRCVCATTVTRR